MKESKNIGIFLGKWESDIPNPSPLQGAISTIPEKKNQKKKLQQQLQIAWKSLTQLPPMRRKVLTLITSSSSSREERRKRMESGRPSSPSTAQAQLDSLPRNRLPRPIPARIPPPEDSSAGRSPHPHRPSTFGQCWREGMGP